MIAFKSNIISPYMVAALLAVACTDVWGNANASDRCVRHAAAILISAKPGDATLCLQRAIDEVFRSGGGRVTLAPGTYDVKSIRLRSNVELYLKTGVHIKASRKPADYDGMIVDDAVEPFDPEVCNSPDRFAASSTNRWNNAVIRIYRACNVAITGEPGSVIDGRNCYDANGEERFRGPHGISVHFSTNVVFSGYEFRDAGNWAHRVCLSSNITVSNICVRGGHDGLDFHACDHVSVSQCDLQTGDDCVAGFDIRDMTVRNCRFNTACSVFRIGGRDILVEDVVVKAPAVHCHRVTLPDADKIAGANPCDRGRRNTLSFFTYYGSDRALSHSGNVVFRRCRMSGVERFIHYDFSGNGWWQTGHPLEDVHFDDMTAEGLQEPLHAYAPRDCPLTMSFHGCHFGFAVPANEFVMGANVKMISGRSLTVKGVAGPFFRSWSGEPIYDIKDLDGVDATTEKAKVPFKVKPI